MRPLSLSLVAEQRRVQGSESAVRGSNIRLAASAGSTHFLYGLTGLPLCDALSTEHTVQIRHQDVETSQLHLQFIGDGGHDSLMIGDVSVTRSLVAQVMCTFCSGKVTKDMQTVFKHSSQVLGHY